MHAVAAQTDRLCSRDFLIYEKLKMKLYKGYSTGQLQIS